MTAEVEAVTLDAFVDSMDRYKASVGNSTLVVAVSGGPDSMALCRLACEWSEYYGIKVVGLTVDHNLRESSAAEALQVSEWLNVFGMEHHTLSWGEGRDYLNRSKSPQSDARDARYHILCNWCNQNGASVILTGHHSDDQVETFLYRLIRGSGIDGLAAMDVHIKRSGISIVRPLLQFSKSNLVATCNTFNQPYIQDFSNHDEKYTRVRIRKLITEFAKEGLDQDRLLNTIAHIRRAKSAITSFVDQFMEDHVVRHRNGSLSFSLKAFSDSPVEIALRVLAKCLMTVGNKRYTPRFSSLIDLYTCLHSADWSSRTLHDCKISCVDKEVLICEEYSNI
jgi:tRNA(Ile)-lysidine synthase